MTGADQVAVKGERKRQQSLLMGGSEVGGGVKDNIRISGLVMGLGHLGVPFVL